MMTRIPLLPGYLKRHPAHSVVPLFIALCYLIFLVSHLNTISIEMDIDASKAGQMQVFWPSNENVYSPVRFKNAPFPAGESKLKIKIPSFNPRLNLRIDPDNKKSTIRLMKVTFATAGHRVDITGRELDKYVIKSIGLKHSVHNDTLELKLNSHDPKIILSNLPLPSVSLIVLLGTATILICFFLGPAYRVAGFISSSWSITSIFIAIPFLLHFLNSVNTNGLPIITILLAISGGFVVSISFLRLQLSSIEEKSSYISNNLIIITFITIILGMMANSLSIENISLMKNQVESAFNEHRKELGKALKSSITALDESFTKQLYGQRKLVSINSESKIFLLGFSPSDKAIVGKENWFFEGYGGRRVEKDITRSFDNITDYMGLNPFSQSELEAWRISLEERYYWLKERGIDYIFALAPTKALIYPEKLPDRILSVKQRLNRLTRYDQLIDYLKRYSTVPVVDLRSALLTAKKQAPQMNLYYRTDFHWNYFGSFIAYQAIIEAINKAYSRHKLNPAELDDFDIRKKTDWVHFGFMNMIGLDPGRHRNDTYLIFQPKPDTMLFNVDDYSIKGISDNTLPNIQGKQIGQELFGLRQVDNPAGKLSMIFVIGDSFIEKTLGYFSKHARKILNFRVVTSFPITPYTVMDMKPDIVVQEILNMYLLQPPPINPPELREARLRAMDKETEMPEQ